MSSEYDPLGRDSHGSDDDLTRVQDFFAAASEPYLSFPWSWLAWALLLPGAALATKPVVRDLGFAGGLGLWSIAILVGGAVEGYGIIRGRRRRRATSLGGWVMRAQGNLSLVALALSGGLLVGGQASLLPGVWLLLLGHSFYGVGALGFPPFRRYGLWYQLGGLVALWPWGMEPLHVFAVTTGAGNLWIAWQVARLR